VPAKRADGEGSIRQLFNGSWDGKISLGIGPVTGKRLRATARRRLIRFQLPLTKPWPQWSQPRIGWVINVTAGGRVGEIVPRWSQPRFGWMTLRRFDAEGGLFHAAMEPADNRLEDMKSRR